MLKVLVYMALMCVDDKDGDKLNMLGVGLRSQETCQRWSMRTNGTKGASDALRLADSSSRTSEAPSNVF